MLNKLQLGFALIAGATVCLSGCELDPQERTGPAMSAGAESGSGAALAPSVSTASDQTAEGLQARHAEPFDLTVIPISNLVLPAFPYLDWPDALRQADRYGNVQEFDRAYVIAGKEVRPVEGHIEIRRFYNADAKLSRVGAERNYDNALKDMGAVKVNALAYDDPELIRLNGGNLGDLHRKLKIDSGTGVSYGTYLLRTPEKNIWIAVAVSDSRSQIITVDEQPMRQSVREINEANTMTARAALLVDPQASDQP